MHSYEIKGYAKINLGLDVVGLLPNGYHEVRMIMQTVGLHDRLVFTPTKAEQVTLQTNVKYLPVNENNLVLKAVKLVKEKFDIPGGLYIKLDKHIPVAAGMAGGSTDAAATLRALNEMYALGMSVSEMRELGVKLGADVPYCVSGGTALAEGIGEKLSKCAPMPKCTILLVKPLISVSTPVVYKKLDGLTGLAHPDIDALLDALRAGDYGKMCAGMGNILENVTAGDYPVINDIKEKMKSYGADAVLMSGSGPTVFGLFGEKKAAEKAFYDFKTGTFGKNTFLTYPYNGSEWE